MAKILYYPETPESTKFSYFKDIIERMILGNPETAQINIGLLDVFFFDTLLKSKEAEVRAGLHHSYAQHLSDAHSKILSIGSIDFYPVSYVGREFILFDTIDLTEHLPGARKIKPKKASILTRFIKLFTK